VLPARLLAARAIDGRGQKARRPRHLMKPVTKDVASNVTFG
jgi:hypothetical protein